METLILTKIQLSVEDWSQVQTKMLLVEQLQAELAQALLTIADLRIKNEAIVRNNLDLIALMEKQKLQIKDLEDRLNKLRKLAVETAEAGYKKKPVGDEFGDLFGKLFSGK